MTLQELYPYYFDATVSAFVQGVQELEPVWWFDTGVLLNREAGSALRLWEDSARTILAEDDADVLGAVDDVSGNTYHVLQATTSLKPTLRLNVINGLPVIRGDGTDDRLVGPTQQYVNSVDGTWTTFAVVKFNDAGLYVPVAMHSGGAVVAQNIRSNGLPVETIAFDDATNSFTDVGPNHGNAFNIVSSIRRPTDVEAYVGGVSSGGPTATTGTPESGTSPITIVGRDPGQTINGDLAAAFQFDRQLSVADWNTLGNLLAGRYNLSWSDS